MAENLASRTCHYFFFAFAKSDKYRSKVELASLTHVIMKPVELHVRKGGKEYVIFMTKSFEIGKVVATRNVWDWMVENEQFGTFVSGCLSRYILYDWGDTCEEDWKANDLAVKNGERVIAVYKIPEDIECGFEESLWIITEWDRSATTLLFPSDY